MEERELFVVGGEDLVRSEVVRLSLPFSFPFPFSFFFVAAAGGGCLSDEAIYGIDDQVSI